MVLEKNNYNILSGLIFFLFIGYILGEAFINLILTLNTIFISYLIFKDFKKYQYNYFSIILLGLFFLYIFGLGLFKSENNLFKNFAYVRFLFLSIGIMIFINSENSKKYIYYLFLVLLSFVAFDAIYQSIFGVNLVGFEKSIERRLTGIFNDEEVLGSYLSKTFLLCAILYCSVKKNNFENLIFYFSSIVILTATYISAERLAIFAITIFFGIFLLLQIKKFIHKLYFIVLSLFILIFFINAIEHIKVNVIAKTLSQVGLNEVSYTIIKDTKIYKNWTIQIEEFNLKEEQKIQINPKSFVKDKFGLKETNKSIYSAHYTTAKKIWLDNFWFGAGVKSFIKNCQKDKYELPNHPYNHIRCSTHPHNIYFQIISEIGIIGFIIFIVILFCLFIKNIKNIFKSDKNILSMLGLIIIFLPLPSGNFFSTWYGSILWIFLGLNFKDFLIKKS